MKRILITGSHGFVGTNLIEMLAPEYEIIRWNIHSDDSMPCCDVIIHLVGLAHDTKKVNNPKRYFEVNTDLTKKIYDDFLKSKAKTFIFFSSIKAQDNDTPYARSKRLAEEYIMGHTENANNKKAYILRPCLIYGKGVKGNLRLLYNVVKKGWPWPLGAFENKRSFTSIDNLCYIIKESLEKDIESGIYNVNDDEAISTNELIEIICSAIGKDAHIWCLPRGFMEGLAKIGGILHLPLNQERLLKLTEDYVSSNVKIKKALGIDQLPVRAKDGLHKTFVSFEE